MIDAAVITLPHRNDRQEHFTQLAETAGLEFRWFPGACETPPRDFRGSAGAWGCAVAHGTLLMQGHGDLLVLEDDAEIPEDFLVRLDEILPKLPEHWGLLKLGGQHIKPPAPVTEGLVQARYMIRTHAYFVRSSYRERVAATALGARMAWDGHFAHLDRLGRSYAPDPLWVSVFPSPSDIPDSLPWEAFK
jgi:hypothetical protein